MASEQEIVQIHRENPRVSKIGTRFIVFIEIS
jgi:hypothetical protein